MKPSAFVKNLIDKYITDEELKKLLIAHSECVASKALKVAEEAGLTDRIDAQFVTDAAMLHDIGVVKCDAPGIHCHGSLPYICHGIAGAEILRKEGVGEPYCRVCERHTGSGISYRQIKELGLPLPLKDYLPETIEEKLICYADKFFSKSGNPEEEKSPERVWKSMARYGDEALIRFEELHNFFKPRPASGN